MKNTTPLLGAGVALAAALTLTGCATSGAETTPATSASAPAEATSTQVNAADEMFVQMMRPHHEQAIEMSDMLLGKTGISPEVTALATEITEAQVPEIEQLSGWADRWGIDPMSGMDHGMAGMMSDSDMQELDAAEGAEAERLFLTRMIEHHTGAIEMAQTEIDDGQDLDAIEMAEGIVATQEDEISRMRALLDS
ncbi:DUF305 domain-containing protein [Clavibacter michiganensis]|uniref:DUF305 domain-containing protein n=1 Tax=Clavibacter michiganensis TaxID=28447 RepID=A0A251YH73_9MICO|nr:DUF305 domain-containing protein [Clavibacter michiganensis]OUE23597.1 hypothetical protein BFL37_13110 [Clavibacter michiganensis]